jgi:cyanate permease
LAAALVLGAPAATVPAFLLAGLGLGNCFPVTLAAAGFTKGSGSVAASVASVATVGYTGYLMGPALIGLLTAGLSLSGALCLLVAAMLVVLLLARQVRVADGSREPHPEAPLVTTPD